MEKFDERQLWIRGKAFQHAYILLAILILLANVYAQFHEGVHIFSPMSEVMVLIMLSVMLTSMELIHKDAYAGNPSNHRMFAIFMVICGGCSFLISLTELISGKQGMIANGMLTDTVASSIMGVCVGFTGLLYLLAYHKEKVQDECLRKEMDQDENNG